MNKILLTVSARTSSTRLPGKVLKKLNNNKEMIIFLLENLIPVLNNPYMNVEIILATSNDSTNDDLVNLVTKNGFSVFRGTEDDVAGRHLLIAKNRNINYLIRITGDCPFVNYEIVNYCLNEFLKNPNYDLYSTKGRFPVGLDLEIINYNTLKENYQAMTNEEKEHYTLYFYNHKEDFEIYYFDCPDEWKIIGEEFVVDTLDDFIKVNQWLKKGNNSINSIKELIELIRR